MKFNEIKCQNLATAWYIQIDQTIVKQLEQNWNLITTKLEAWKNLTVMPPTFISNSLKEISNNSLSWDIAEMPQTAEHNLQTAPCVCQEYVIIKHEI